MDYTRLQGKFREIEKELNYKPVTNIKNYMSIWYKFRHESIDLVRLKVKLDLLECILKEVLNSKGLANDEFINLSLLTIIDKYYSTELDLIEIRSLLIKTSDLIGLSSDELIDETHFEFVDTAASSRLWDLCNEIKYSHLRKREFIDMKVVEIEYEKC